MRADPTLVSPRDGVRRAPGRRGWRRSSGRPRPPRARTVRPPAANASAAVARRALSASTTARSSWPAARIVTERPAGEGGDQHAAHHTQRRHGHARRQRPDHRRGQGAIETPCARVELQGQLALQRGRLSHQSPASELEMTPPSVERHYTDEGGVVHLVDRRCVDGRAGAFPAEAVGAGHQRLERADVDHAAVRSADSQRRSQPGQPADRQGVDDLDDRPLPGVSPQPGSAVARELRREWIGPLLDRCGRSHATACRRATGKYLTEERSTPCSTAAIASSRTSTRVAQR